MYELVFLFCLALVWIIFASVQDLKKREVANWLNFSLIIFVLGFRFFYSLFSQENFVFFYYGLIGLGVFFILGNLLYYGRMFAGGDAKLMISLGTVLLFSNSLISNFKIFVLFFIIFLFAGSFYGFVWSIVLSIKNSKRFKKEFCRLVIKDKKIIFFIASFGFIVLLSGFLDFLFFYFGILILIFPFFYLYAKSIDEVCMVKEIETSNLTEGDWLYKDLKIGKSIIKSNWNGLTKEDIKKIQKKYRTVKIKQGIPFVPVFLISFLVLLYLWNVKLFF